MRHLMLAGLGLALLAACAPQEPPAAAANPLAGAPWVALEIAALPVLAEHPATLEVQQDGSVTGRSGCNGFAGASTLQGDSIAFGALAATKMACPEPQMEQEGRYFTALVASRRFLLEGDTLRLLDAGGATVVLYRR
jgi:heat shock protein HslJ